MKKTLFIILSASIFFARLLLFSSPVFAALPDYGCTNSYPDCRQDQTGYFCVDPDFGSSCYTHAPGGGKGDAGTYCCKNAPSGPLCCPTNYDTTSCPAGTNTSTQCCQVAHGTGRGGGSSWINYANKIACSSGGNVVNFKICSQTGAAQSQCEACSSDGSKIWTAIGCIPTDSNGILTAFVRLALSMGGGVVLLMTLAAAFQLTTSKGDPKATEEAKNKITAAVSGLLFIIFSMVLLKTIGITVLQIPGF